MKYPSLGEFFKRYLRYKQHWNKKTIDMKDAVWQELDDDYFLFDTAFKKGSTFKIFETRNFGWIVFGPDARTVDDMIPNKRIFKY
jgi:hypothetical protein